MFDGEYDNDQAAPTPVPSEKRWLRIALWGVGLIGIGSFVVLAHWNEQLPPIQNPAATNPDELAEPASFNGSSEKLKRTMFVPTLETPIEDGKSAVWCATLPLAWKQIETEVTKGPLDLAGVESLCKSLRGTPDCGLDSEDYFAAAGRYNDGIIERIRQELPRKFPGAPLPRQHDPDPESGLAYAYLQVDLQNRFPFTDIDEPLMFHDDPKHVSPVRAYGIDSEGGENPQGMRNQVRVLYRIEAEFAIDLNQWSNRYQIILARMDRKSTLAETLRELDSRIERTPEDQKQPLNGIATLRIPNMDWRIDHHFAELENKPAKSASAGIPILQSVEQSVRFKMDRNGTYVSSGAVIHFGNGHLPKINLNEFFFDRPYMIIMKKRDWKQPFLVVWVENIELLQPK